MEQEIISTTIRSITYTVGVTVLLLIGISHLNDLLFPSPLFKKYVTATDETSALYKEQLAAFAEAKKQPEAAHFVVRTCAGLALLFGGIFISSTFLGTALVAVGIVELSYSSLIASEAIPAFIRFLILLVALFCSGFSLYRWDKKKMVK